MTMHEEEVVLADDVARVLIAGQFPEWAHEPIRHVTSSGTVNAIFQIGDRYAARFPLLGTDVDEAQRVVEAEARASAEFAGASSFPTAGGRRLRPPRRRLPVALVGADLAVGH